MYSRDTFVANAEVDGAEYEYILILKWQMQIQNKYSTQFCLFFTKQVHQSEVSTDHFKWKYRIIILRTFVFLFNY